METLNDIGAVEFLGVRTLTVAIYDTWLDRNSLAGAAQIACVMLLFVFVLLLIERALRARHSITTRPVNTAICQRRSSQAAKGFSRWGFARFPCCSVSCCPPPS